MAGLSGLCLVLKNFLIMGWKFLFERGLLLWMSYVCGSLQALGMKISRFEFVFLLWMGLNMSFLFYF